MIKIQKMPSPSFSSSPRFLNLLLILTLTLLQLPSTTHSYTLLAAGASFPERFYKSVFFTFSSETGNDASYTSLGSGRGKCRILQNCDPTDTSFPTKIDFAGSDSIHGYGDYLLEPDLQMFPAVSGAVVVVYNVPGLSDLTLPLPVIANIFRQCQPGTICPPNSISRWDDPQIINANPGIDTDVLTAAGTITVVVRSDKSGTTEIFKTALTLASSSFAQQMVGHTADDNVWTNATVIKGNTNSGVSSQVLATVNSIGYVSLDEARNAGLKYAAVGKSNLQADGKLRATSKAIEYALLERGFNFGNNGDNPAHLTVAVPGAVGSEAWPIVGVTYFSVRKNSTTRFLSNTDLDECNASRRIVMHFFEYFYRSKTVELLAESHGFVPLPEEGRQLILSKIRARFGTCSPNIVTIPSNLVFTNEANFPVLDSSQSIRTRQVTVNMYISSFIYFAISIFQDSYSVRPDAPIFTRVPSTDNASIIVVEHDIAISFKQTHLVLDYAGAAWGVNINLCSNYTQCDVVMNPSVVQEILLGTITKWNDDKIISLNPSLTLPAQDIILVGFNDSSIVDSFQSVLNTRLRTKSSTSLWKTANLYAKDFDQANRLVAATQYSLTFGFVVDTSGDLIFHSARFMDASNTVPVQPNGKSVGNCIDNDAGGIGTNNNVGCWPLSVAYSVLIRKEFSNDQCLTRTPQESVTFVDYLFTSSMAGSLPLAQIGMSFLPSTVNSPQASGVLDSFTQTRNSIATITCFSKSISQPQIDLKLIPFWLTTLAIVMASILLTGFVCIACWVRLNRDMGPIKASNPIFSLIMLIGFSVEVSTVFLMSLQEPNYSKSQLDAACMAQPWLFMCGYGLVYGALLIKTYRIHRIFNNPRLLVVKITRWDNIRLFILFLAPVVGMLILWTTISPLKYERTVSELDPTLGTVTATQGQCVGGMDWVFLGPIIGFYVCVVLTGLIIAWKNRTAPVEFSESRYVTGAIVADFELLIIGIPVLVLASTSTISSFIIKFGFIVLSTLGTAFLFFWPKFALIHGFWDISTDLVSANSTPRRGSYVDRQKQEESNNNNRAAFSFRMANISSPHNNNNNQTTNNRLSKQPSNFLYSNGQIIGFVGHDESNKPNTSSSGEVAGGNNGNNNSNRKSKEYNNKTLRGSNNKLDESPRGSFADTSAGTGSVNNNGITDNRTNPSSFSENA
jgi:ABC-type phosphate transport system substrate-binding protein